MNIDNFYKKKLGNGLTVLFEKRSLPVVSVSASVNYGTAYESEKIKGTAHFLEHLMFKGTKTRSQEEIAREIEKKGGVLNAYTAEEVTSYWDKLPSRHLASGINIASDLILNPSFDPIEFEREKNVILEEIKMYHDNPPFYSLEKIKSLLYKKPFGMSSVDGAEEVIKNIKRQEIIDIFNRNYSTDAMILTVVGDADFDEICEIAERIYPAKKRSMITHSPVKINSEKTEKRKGIDQAHFVFGFHAPRLADDERYLYLLAGAYLFDGMSSRLFQEIREKRGLAYSVKGSFDLGKDYGFGMIYCGTRTEKIREIKKLILKEFNDLKNLNQKDFEECKEQVIGAEKIEEEDSSNAMNMLMAEEIAGDAEEYYKYEERINSVKLEKLKNLKLKGYSTFSLIPE